MGDVINIVVHPGHCVSYEGYDKEVYYKQLDKGNFNVFLHPTVDNDSRQIVIGHELKKIMKDSRVNRTVSEVESLIKSELEEGDNVNIPYASYMLRSLVFSRVLSIRKIRRINKKGYCKMLNKLINLNKLSAYKYMLHLSKSKPIIYGNKTHSTYLDFRKTLENRYPSRMDNLDHLQHNAHMNATYFNNFERDFINFFKEDCEEDDKIYVFGEYYNQCVKAFTNILDKHNINYELLSELTSFNSNCPKTGKDLDYNNKHFLITGGDDE